MDYELINGKPLLKLIMDEKNSLQKLDVKIDFTSKKLVKL